MTPVVIEQVRNDRIQYATVLPDSPFVSAGREVRITAPPEVLKLLGPGAENHVPALLSGFESVERDWASNLVLYAMTGRDAMLLGGFEQRIEKWRESQKAIDLRHWTEWWDKHRGHLAWDGTHLVAKQ